MPATNGKAPPKETWRDWLPHDAPPEIRHPDRLVTREEIAARLAEAGVTATPDDMRYWEQIGALPRGVRQRHLGATRSVYPTWFVFLVWGLREFQAEGLSLEQARERLRALFKEALRIGGGNPSPIADMIARDSLYRGLETVLWRTQRLSGRDVASIDAAVIVRYADGIDADTIHVSIPSRRLVGGQADQV